MIISLKRSLVCVTHNSLLLSLYLFSFGGCVYRWQISVLCINHSGRLAFANCQIWTPLFFPLCFFMWEPLSTLIPRLKHQQLGEELIEDVRGVSACWTRWTVLLPGFWAWGVDHSYEDNPGFWGVRRRAFCFTGHAFGHTAKWCSITSLGTPDISDGVHANKKTVGVLCVSRSA